MARGPRLLNLHSPFCDFVQSLLFVPRTLYSLFFLLLVYPYCTETCDAVALTGEFASSHLCCETVIVTSQPTPVSARNARSPPRCTGKVLSGVGPDRALVSGLAFSPGPIHPSSELVGRVVWPLHHSCKRPELQSNTPTKHWVVELAWPGPSDHGRPSPFSSDIGCLEASRDKHAWLLSSIPTGLPPATSEVKAGFAISAWRGTEDLWLVCLAGATPVWVVGSA
jgi:hypothetical protein